MYQSVQQFDRWLWVLERLLDMYISSIANFQYKTEVMT